MVKIQKFNPNDVFPDKKKNRITASHDETIVQIRGSEPWLWVAIEPIPTILIYI
jgi:transposase-like protein